MGPALGRAAARGQQGLRHHGTSRRQMPTSAHARCRAGNGEERGGPYALKPRHAPALEPPASRTVSAPPRSQGPMVPSPSRASHSKSFAGPALGRAAARGPRGFRHHGTSRRQTPTARRHAVGPGTGKSGADPTRSNPATLPL